MANSCQGLVYSALHQVLASLAFPIAPLLAQNERGRRKHTNFSSSHIILGVPCNNITVTQGGIKGSPTIPLTFQPYRVKRFISNLRCLSGGPQAL